METELELKHVAPYLPYELKVYNSIHENISIMVSDPTMYNNPLIGVKGINFIDGRINNPILHPLSDLTKEIEHNGEKFVPIYELFNIQFKDTAHVEYIRNMYFIETNNFINASHYSTSEESSFNKRNIKLNNYWKIEKLYEWHFDIDGLIEKGLAIDINTLNNI